MFLLQFELDGVHEIVIEQNGKIYSIIQKDYGDDGVEFIVTPVWEGISLSEALSISVGIVVDALIDSGVIPTPNDLMTQKDIAALHGISVAAVNNALRDGRLFPYRDATAKNPRVGGTLVSKAEADVALSKEVSVRKSRRGDYLVFRPMPLPPPAPNQIRYLEGMDTAEIYARFDSPEEAEAFAIQMGNVVPYEAPRLKNAYLDGNPLYPNRKEYMTIKDAQEDGWIRVPKGTIDHYNGKSIKVVDVSPPNSFGYDFAIKVAGYPEEFARSSSLYIRGPLGFYVRFRSGDVADGIVKARQFIDQLPKEIIE